MPLKGAHALLFFRYGPGFAAIGAHHINLILVSAIGKESDPLSIRREGRRGAAVLRIEGELERRLSIFAEPNLHVIAIVIPVCRLLKYQNAPSIGGDDDTIDSPERNNLFK